MRVLKQIAGFLLFGVMMMMFPTRALVVGAGLTLVGLGSIIWLLT